MPLQSRAIVLSVTDFGEADRYVQLFTQKWGVITALAKSARKSKKRYVGGLDLFCHNEILLRGDPKQRPYLQELTVLNSFQHLRTNLEKIFIAGKVTQWTKKLTDQAVPMNHTFSLLGQTLSLIEKEDDPQRLELLLLVFKLKLLTHIGLKPRVDSCVECGKVTDQKHVLFHLSQGGIICRSCLDEQKNESAHFIGPHEVGLITQGVRLRLTEWSEFQAPPRSVRMLNPLMAQFGSFHFHVKLPV